MNDTVREFNKNKEIFIPGNVQLSAMIMNVSVHNGSNEIELIFLSCITRTKVIVKLQDPKFYKKHLNSVQM